jgi:hypothetical protein
VTETSAANAETPANDVTLKETEKSFFFSVYVPLLVVACAAVNFQLVN